MIILVLIAVGIVISGAMSISKGDINIKDPSMIILLSLVGAFALVIGAAYVSKYKKKSKTSRGDSARKTSTSAPKVEQVQSPRRSGSPRRKKGGSPKKSTKYQGLLAQDLASKIVVHDDDSDMNSTI